MKPKPPYKRDKKGFSKFVEWHSKGEQNMTIYTSGWSDDDA